MRGEAPPDPEQGWARPARDRERGRDGGSQRANLRLCGTQDAVQKVLDRTGLGGLIPSYPDRATALAAF